jgi:RNA polymerase sigma-70 factor (TIGR02957 family)
VNRVVTEAGGAGAAGRDDEFIDLRPLLVAVAYELLGSVGDAEDVVQDAWLRWREVDRAVVRDPRAYLCRTVSRLALNRLRTVQRRREDYVGPWLPEPLVAEDDVVEQVARAEAVSTAMLVVLESLLPVERVVFVLREVFGFGVDEVARVVDRTPANVRQIARRARSHVEARRPRSVPEPEEHRIAVERFKRAAETGDVELLVSLLAPDVELTTDGGGAVKAALRPIVGRDKVVRFLASVMAGREDAEVRVVQVNGAAGLVFRFGGVLDTVATFDVAGGVARRVYVLRNPAKLSRLGD